MHSWLDVRSAVLDEIISLDGPGDVQADFCGSCLSHKTAPLYRCLECSYGSLLCGECVVGSHRTLPLHRLEVCPFPTCAPSFADVFPSAGRMGFLTEHLYTLLDSSVTSDTEVLPVPRTRPSTILSLSTLTAGTDSKLDSAAAGQVLHRLSVIASSCECAGTLHPSTVPERCFPLTCSKHTTKLRYKGS